MENSGTTLDANRQSYSINGSGLLYTSPYGKEVLIPFGHPSKLKRSPWSGALYFSSRQGKAPLHGLAHGKQWQLIESFYSQWRSSDPSAAKKSAFDYIDGQKQFLPIAIVVSLLFCLPLSVALLNDSKEQVECTKVLQADSTLGEMAVTKFRKKRKGHYILQLHLTTQSGVDIKGQDQLILGKEGRDEEIEAKIPKTVPVVYSPSNPKCWSLTPNLQGSEVNWAKRRYFAAFTFLFGCFFFFTGLTGLVWGTLSLLRARPHKAELAKMFSL